MENVIPVGLLWKLRRVAADWRQQDVANVIGSSTTRYSGIERGDLMPTELETRLFEQHVPLLAFMRVETSAEKLKEGVPA
jgi:transcriptional regulator with XRE-family HTH domain